MQHCQWQQWKLHYVGSDNTHLLIDTGISKKNELMPV